MLVQTRIELIRNAAEAAIILSRQLNYLLDAFDFYTQRYEAVTPSEKLEIEDLATSIREIGQLPLQVTARLEHWRRDQVPTLDWLGFEVNVLNEMNLHMNAIATFMFRKGIDLEPFDSHLVGQSFLAFRKSNELLK